MSFGISIGLVVIADTAKFGATWLETTFVRDEILRGRGLRFVGVGASLLTN